MLLLQFLCSVVVVRLLCTSNAIPIRPPPPPPMMTRPTHLVWRTNNVPFYLTDGDELLLCWRPLGCFHFIAVFNQS
jgi:hypothetical protein